MIIALLLERAEGDEEIERERESWVEVLLKAASLGTKTLKEGQFLVTERENRKSFEYFASIAICRFLLCLMLFYRESCTESNRYIALERLVCIQYELKGSNGSHRFSN